MNIRIIAVGKIKELYIRQLIGDRVRNIAKIYPIDIVEIPDEKAPENLSVRGKDLVRKKEGLGILDSIRSGAYVVALAIEGKDLTTKEFANRLRGLKDIGRDRVDFIIGGSLGLDERVKSKADLLLSFSRLTFPHQLMRLILLDQIHRVILDRAKNF